MCLLRNSLLVAVLATALPAQIANTSDFAAISDPREMNLAHDTELKGIVRSCNVLASSAYAWLGAERGEIVGMLIRRGMRIALTGIDGGILAALALTRLLASMLYDVKANDPATFFAVALYCP